MNCFAPMSYLTRSALWQLFKKAAIAALLFLLLLVIYGPGYAQETNPPAGKEDGKRLLILPYPFFNDTIGTGIGAAKSRALATLSRKIADEIKRLHNTSVGPCAG